MSKLKDPVSFYTTHTAAKKLLVTPTTIIAYIKDKKIKSLKTLGKHRRIPAEEINRVWKEMNAGYEGGQ